ncbi:hypothetical protein TKK_0010404 [Trichogramma kaykai]|uniref:C2H2-type domain-containing protein n=1 Tax=Trichogramma kaykai TaxID=54128 RepID=A0ABD2WYQ6_9HYME
MSITEPMITVRDNDEASRTAESTVCSVCETLIEPKSCKNKKKSASTRAFRVFKCTDCSKTFTLQQHLKRHVKTVHGHLKELKCDQCNKSFRDSTYLRKHVDVVHKKVKSFQCPQCSKLFGFKENMKKHLRACKIQL